MAKSIPSSGAGAVRIILKNKENFHFSLRNKGQVSVPVFKVQLLIWKIAVFRLPMF